MSPELQSLSAPSFMVLTDGAVCQHFDSLENKNGEPPIDLMLLATFAAPPNKFIDLVGSKTGTGLSGDIFKISVVWKISKKTSPKISMSSLKFIK